MFVLWVIQYSKLMFHQQNGAKHQRTKKELSHIKMILMRISQVNLTRSFYPWNFIILCIFTSFPHNFRFYALSHFSNTPEAKYICSGWNNNISWAIKWGSIFFRNNQTWIFWLLTAQWKKRRWVTLHLQTTYIVISYSNIFLLLSILSSLLHTLRANLIELCSSGLRPTVHLNMTGDYCLLLASKGRNSTLG